MQDRERIGDINKQGRGIGRERVNIQMLVVWVMRGGHRLNSNEVTSSQTKLPY